MRSNSLLHETFTVFALNLRNALTRPLLPAIIVIGFLAVVLVLVAVLSIGRGIDNTFSRTNAADVAMVLSNGAYSETVSHLDRTTIQTLASRPGIVQTPQGPLVSPELVTTVNVPKQGSGIESNVVMRGVTDAAFQVHAKVHIVKGRRFRAGVKEVIVGRQAAREYQGLRVGDTLHVGRDRWKVAGIFTSNGNLRESEIWTDVRGLQTAFHMGNSYSDAYVRLISASAFKPFKAALKKTPGLNVQIETEKSYYAKLAGGASRIIAVAGVAVAVLMALGAIIGAINLLYTNLAARLREMATLRAVGYRRLPVLAAVMLEALTFGLIGGIGGGGIAYAAFNGYQAGTLMGGVTQVAFQFAVTPGLLAGGIIFALIMGFIGGLFPAIRAARLPIVTALGEA